MQEDGSHHASPDKDGVNEQGLGHTKVAALLGSFPLSVVSRFSHRSRRRCRFSLASSPFVAGELALAQGC